ncbi:MAG: hypothetical protein R3C61_05550 [Bacteroidia bacterium]
MPKSKKTPFKSNKVHLNDARILSFNVGGSSEIYVAPEEISGINFQVKSEESFNQLEKRVRIILNIIVDILINENESSEQRLISEFGKYRIGFSFLVDNFDELIHPSGEMESPASVDGTLVTHLLAIAYATARGMILVKTTGTSLEGAILPIIDPSELLDKALEN